MLSMGQPDVKGIYMVDNFMEDSFFSLFFYLYCQLVAQNNVFLKFFEN
jgi:hypothetical protein